MLRAQNVSLMGFEDVTQNKAGPADLLVHFLTHSSCLVIIVFCDVNSALGVFNLCK
jgi:hypothetical protein